MDIKDRDRDRIKQIIFHLENDEFKYKNLSKELDYILHNGLNVYEWGAFSRLACSNIMVFRKYRELLELFLSHSANSSFSFSSFNFFDKSKYKPNFQFSLNRYITLSLSSTLTSYIESLNSIFEISITSSLVTKIPCPINSKKHGHGLFVNSRLFLELSTLLQLSPQAQILPSHRLHLPHEPAVF